MPLVKAIQVLLEQYPEGLPVKDMQQLLYTEHGMKFSYRDIEEALLENSELFSEREWKWMNRKPV